jgi:hypothetical protein
VGQHRLGPDNGRPAPTGRCKHCGRRTYGGATACKSRQCEGYAPLWAGDWRRVLFDNLRVCGDLGGEVKGLDGKAVMLALTAPGQDPVWDERTGEIICEGLPWDDAWCAARGKHKHSGREGCRVDPIKASAWNVTADARWSALHRRCATETRRLFGNGALVMLARAKELQGRGVIHWHPVLLAGTPRQRSAASDYADRMRALAPQYGFGFVSMKLKPQSAAAAAAYLSSYFVTGKKEKAQLQESVKHPALKRGRIIWLSPKLTQRTGVTMRELRFRRYVWVRFRGFAAAGGVWVDVARYLAEVERDRGVQLTGEEVAQLLTQETINRWFLDVPAAGKVREEPQAR